MKEDKELSSYSFDCARNIAREVAGEDYTEDMEVVLAVALSDKRNLPSFRMKGKVIPLEDYIPKWVAAYSRGYKNRPSIKKGKQSATIPDPLVKEILKMRIAGISDDLADKVEGGHSLSMSIENLIGELLEEYLAQKLSPHGWFCCWGSTIDAVDFCKRDGSLLQIKTSDDSENSSSKQVRNGTTIDKWFRRFSRKKEGYNWYALNKLVKTKEDFFSEIDFRSFVRRTVDANPDCIFVAEDNLLKIV